MKIAIVNQYCDLILPPVQNSVGACTYVIASRLATEAEFHVFGLVQDGGPAREVEDAGVRYRLFRAAAGNQRLMRRFDRLARLYRPLNGGMTVPRSGAGWVYPGYGRAVARALARDRFDIVLFQHTSQYIPVVRRWNPHTRLVLNVHHELYPQCNHRAGADGLLRGELHGEAEGTAAQEPRRPCRVPRRCHAGGTGARLLTGGCLRVPVALERGLRIAAIASMGSGEAGWSRPPTECVPIFKNPVS